MVDKFPQCRKDLKINLGLRGKIKGFYIKIHGGKMTKQGDRRNS